MEVGVNGSYIACSIINGSMYCNDTLGGVEKTKVELYIIVVILCIICLMGTIGNATSFYIYFKRRDKSTSVIFILALAGMDFLTCLIIVPYTIVFELLEYELCYDILCKLYLFLITSNIPFSAYIMTAIAFDRYFCICHPFFKAFTVVRAKIIVWCLACLTFTFGVITSLSYGTYAYESTMGEGDYQEEEVYAYIMTNDTLHEEYDLPSNISDNIIHYGGCHQNGILISIDFINSYYQKFYSASFIVAFVIVVVLYIMIYHSILMRRAKKAKRRKKTNYNNSTLADSTPTNVNNMLIVLKPMNGNIDINKDTSKQRSKRSNTAKDTTLIANIRTALTLFVVTIVFIIAFLPSFLMAHDLLPFNMIVFNLYFSYNVANPFIYAFLNSTFRGDLQNIIKMCK